MATTKKSTPLDARTHRSIAAARRMAGEVLAFRDNEPHPSKRGFERVAGSIC